MLASLGWRPRSVWLCAGWLPPKHSPLEGHHSFVRPGTVLSLGFPTEIAQGFDSRTLVTLMWMWPHQNGSTGWSQEVLHHLGGGNKPP